MAVFRTGLTRQEDQLLGAVPIVVLVHDELHADRVDIVQTEIGHLDITHLLGVRTMCTLLRNSTALLRTSGLFSDPWRASSRMF